MQAFLVLSLASKTIDCNCVFADFLADLVWSSLTADRVSVFFRFTLLIFLLVTTVKFSSSPESSYESIR